MPPKKVSKSAPEKNRGYVFTLNNWTTEEREILKKVKCRYIVFGEEIAPKTGTPHLQGYVYFTDAKTRSAVTKNLGVGKRIWFEKESEKATVEQRINYCKKECNNIFEIGEPPNQGCRGDIETLAHNIQTGEITCDQIVIENPFMFHQYGRTFQKSEDIALRRKFRTEMTEGIWYFGETGKGKSERAFKDFNPKTHYNVPVHDKGWWDGYTGQEIVILNDFRGEYNYQFMLNLVDRYPFNVSRRCREPVPLLAKKVIITSSIPPWDIYKNRLEEDKIQQLLRRFKVYQCVDREKTLEIDYDEYQ